METNVVNLLKLRRVVAASPPVVLANVTENVLLIKEWAVRANEEGAHVVVFPELCITGYSIADLFAWSNVLVSALDGLSALVEWTAQHTAILVVGLPIEVESNIYNCAAVVGNGTIYGIVPKSYLPNSREYYEQRWFTSGLAVRSRSIIINRKEVPFGTDLLFCDAANPDFSIGIELCEDLWSVQPPSSALAQAGATVLLNLSASNELIGKRAYRTSLVTSQAARCYAAYAYASAGPTESTSDTVYSGHCLVSECGELLADSGTLCLKGAWAIADVDLERIAAERRISATFKQHASVADFRRVEFTQKTREQHSITHTINKHPFVPAVKQDRWQRCAEILQIQATGLAVRMQHAAVKKVVLGLSGGLDSTWALLVCHEACSILGLDSSTVLAVSMPGFGTSQRTQTNARLLAECFSSEFSEIDIRKAVEQHFNDIGHEASNHNTVYENAQARERTQVLMDVANQVGGIVVGTGDLSEMALGWCTYNGDHMSMYAVNSGVPKTLIRHLVEWFAIERAGVDAENVLRDVLDTPISPELLPVDAEGNISQNTEATIGPYEVHDFYLYHLVRYGRSITSTAARAIIAFEGTYTPVELLQWLEIFVTRFFASQFKRNCQPDGVKIGSVGLSPRADWRLPSEASAMPWLAEIKSAFAIFA